MKELKSKLRILFSFVGAAILLLLTISLFSARGQDRCITVGAKNCTEQNLLSEIIAILIEEKTDIKVRRRYNLEGTTITFHSLTSGGIDLYVEYTGTALLDILKQPLCPTPHRPFLEKVFDEKFAIKWMPTLGFSNQYVLIARKELGIARISEVDAHHTIAFDPEFQVRPELALLRTVYDHPFEGSLMDQVLLYFSLQNGSIDLISGFSTDGRLEDPSFCVLEDDLGCLPAYEAAPLVRSEVLQKFPELYVVFQLLEGKIDEQEMRRMNHLVEFEGKKVSEVARNFLKNLQIDQSDSL